MNEDTRSLMFWLGCIPARAGLAYAAKEGGEDATKLLRLGAVVPAAVWLGGLMDEKAQGFAGGEVWWADARQYHGLLWAAYAVFGDWRFLATDVGLAAALKLSLR